MESGTRSISTVRPRYGARPRPHTVPVRPITEGHERLRAALARRIKKARVASGLQVAEVLRRVGIARMTWWNWENGRAAIPSEFIPGIAAILGTTVADLYGSQVAAARRAA